MQIGVKKPAGDCAEEMLSRVGTGPAWVVGEGGSSQELGQAMPQGCMCACANRCVSAYVHVYVRMHVEVCANVCVGVCCGWSWECLSLFSEAWDSWLQVEFWDSALECQSCWPLGAAELPQHLVPTNSLGLLFKCSSWLRSSCISHKPLGCCYCWGPRP